MSMDAFIILPRNSTGCLRRCLQGKTLTGKADSAKLTSLKCFSPDTFIRALLSCGNAAKLAQGRESRAWSEFSSALIPSAITGTSRLTAELLRACLEVLNLVQRQVPFKGRGKSVYLLKGQSLGCD